MSRFGEQSPIEVFQEGTENFDSEDISEDELEEEMQDDDDDDDGACSEILA